MSIFLKNKQQYKNIVKSFQFLYFIENIYYVNFDVCEWSINDFINMRFSDIIYKKKNPIKILK